MNVEITLEVRLPDFGRVDFIQPIDPAYLRGNIVVQSLERECHVAVFINPPIRFVQVLIHQVDTCLVGNLSHFCVLIPVNDIGLGSFAIGGGKQHLLYDILDLFHSRDLFTSYLLG